MVIQYLFGSPQNIACVCVATVELSEDDTSEGEIRPAGIGQENEEEEEEEEEEDEGIGQANESMSLKAELLKVE